MTRMTAMPSMLVMALGSRIVSPMKTVASNKSKGAKFLSGKNRKDGVSIKIIGPSGRYELVHEKSGRIVEPSKPQKLVSQGSFRLHMVVTALPTVETASLDLLPPSRASADDLLRDLDNGTFAATAAKGDWNKIEGVVKSRRSRVLRVA
ncbi:MAG: hypothetical protein H7067_08695 [Burkholderiales bacterium]|nr:hypothetical protein [Opitutaceae bacterium]